METEQFEKLVAKAVEGLPDEFRERLDNVDIVVADEPTRKQLSRRDRKRGDTLLGLYEGVPLTERNQGYGYVVPDVITIFQLPLEAMCKTDDQLIKEIQHVVLHEIAHHFGISDDRLRELGRY
jgi:predicted Zn-dependent protease with MMP-like domain